MVDFDICGLQVLDELVVGYVVGAGCGVDLLDL